MTELFLQTVNLSYRVSFLILAILLLRLVLKKAPKWISVALWGIAAVRLLLPFSLESVFSMVPSGDLVTPEIMLDPTPTIQSGIPAVNDVINPIIQHSFAPAPGDSMNPLQLWLPVAAIIWTVGFAVMVLYTLISYWKLKKQVSGGEPVCGRIYRSKNVPSPFVLGLLRPRIYLPDGISETDEAFVIAHEEAHIHRRDHWWKPIGFLLLSLHWFNPLMWLGYIFLCRDIELACDEKVIEKLGEEVKADYSQALLNCSVSRKRIAACPLAFGEVGVKQRIRSVLHYKKPAFWILIAAIVVCCVVAVCFLTDPMQAHPGKPELIFDYKVQRENSVGTQVPGRTSITLEIYCDKLFISHGMNTQQEEIAFYDTEQPFFHIEQAYFCDLTGDGVAELCAQLSMGSGIIDHRIWVYDFVARERYELQDRFNRDFFLYEENDTLMVRVVPKGALKEMGFYQLALKKTAFGQWELTYREYTPTSGNSSGISTGINSITLSDSGELTLKYYYLSGGYSVEMVPYDAWEYCGDGMIPYDGALGTYRMMISFGDTVPTNSLRELFPAGQVCTLKYDSPDFGTVKAKLVYPSDHGFVLYVGSDMPFTVTPENKQDMDHLLGKLTIRLQPCEYLKNVFDLFENVSGDWYDFQATAPSGGKIYIEPDSVRVQSSGDILTNKLLFSNGRVYSAFLCDLNGDNIHELCLGVGVHHSDRTEKYILVYNFADESLSRLQDPDYEYSLLCTDDQLRVIRKSLAKNDTAPTLEGTLILSTEEDGTVRLTIIP